MKSHENHISLIGYVLSLTLLIIGSIILLPVTSFSKNAKTPVERRSIVGDKVQSLSFEIMPNPVISRDNSIDVSMKIEGIDQSFPVQILVYNTIGNLVYRMDLSVDAPTVQFQFKPKATITEGLYFVSILNGTNRVTRRMVVNSSE
ncbi:T9SS type A sorting domain-containing protein [Flammeovirga pectinis]|uniref:T9SS type A sorting domain-containing protein n=1 Tax=Flammeovirga pectinis TaxID=2494373 RepID=A0A3Q9FRC3_9BACT|nr:T9SS type A sorting domain-containing protein [Flammeovirga pectinis]AZQ63469.1 T9SS type A sorting domain-containing protein [Flammeovirga pectinis]